MSARKNLQNMIFGDILVLEFDKQKNTHAQWKCLCMLCNELTYVTASNLKRGTKSCPSCGQKKTNYMQEFDIISRLTNGDNKTQVARDVGVSRHVIYRVEKEWNKYRMSMAD